ncbi:hypothetical protein, partial [Clostridium perfringens]
WRQLLKGIAMCMPGQHNNSLFAGIDGSQLKTFSLEVDCHRVEDALFAFEKAILQIKLAQRHFSPESSSYDGIRAVYRFTR